ncbi:acetyl-CoA hydrolase [Flavobacterium akiainvivens]|uniref:Acetyl-CoA hydrolase n=1 Tax=Flavobacterium akiainvivens TaxID=1202724 RepID=A0A0M8MG55_9FLAO|nr:succinate CoA transferase [Flavobacterium akiainvivens]KOS08184.1 acetyl-CoA hydrolase [Flavobacterium akiainvivens]SFQ50554.1 acetyl-CoA hydrolase/succinyl-CoA:acetate CoA-transferase [Flavobacterium akiainvivens]
MDSNRIQYEPYKNRIITANEAAALFTDGAVVGSSGFTKAGDSKAVLPAFAKRAVVEDIGITLITGASLGHTTDSDLAEANALYRRMPFQVDNVLRQKINNGDVMFIDQHLSETAELLTNKHLPKMDYAVIEALEIDQNGNIIPTTSIGNSAAFAQLSEKVIIEINTSLPLSFKGIHDVFIPKNYPERDVINITTPNSRIGKGYIKVDPDKVVGIVFTELPDSPAQVAEPDDNTIGIAEHLMAFFKSEVQSGRLSPSLMPLQAGIGKIANAVMMGFLNSPFKNLTMYSEVLQDSTFHLIDAGIMDFASASSITVSQECHDNLIKNFDKYQDKIVLRPQNISNSPEVIRRLGVIAINTAIEFDIYGNVNSTHLSGTKMMNGIGGSGDFARNAYLSVFVTPSISKGGAISHVVPMVPHTDHTEHDVDILVTDQGLADLRGLAPRERAKVVIENCVHPDYKEALQDYFERACQLGGHTPHILGEAFAWHAGLAERGSMKPFCPA